jgi:hypothetical protein
MDRRFDPGQVARLDQTRAEAADWAGTSRVPNEAARRRILRGLQSEFGLVHGTSVSTRLREPAR